MAVIGVGRIGMVHADNLARRVGQVRLVAVTTSKQERSLEIKNLPGEVRVFSTVEQMLAGQRLDAVVVASSTAAHVGGPQI